MKNKKYLFIILFFAIFLILCCNVSYAGSQKMKELDYKVELNEDGSMDVEETWNIKVTDTNTLFKTFEIDSSKYKEIINVSVEEVQQRNETIPFTQIYKEMYHVTKDCFYALKNSSGDFEIAWGVSIDGTKNVTYKIKYTVVDAIKVYKDCSELYWQFLSTDNGIPVDKVTGTITLPSKVENKENLRAWAHGPLNGEIQIPSNKNVTFEVENLDSETMLEVRVVTKEDIFYESTNIKNSNKFDSIIKEETEWANEANSKRTRAKIFVVVVNVIMILAAIWFIRKTIKYIKKLKEVKKKEPETKVEYYRDIPDEKATPADAAFLYYFQSGRIRQNISKILSATILDLALKKMLTFEIEPGEKEEIKIQLKENSDTELSASEQIIFEQLQKVAKANEGRFSIKQLQKYIKDHSERFVKDLEKIEVKVEKEQEQKQNYDTKIKSEGSKYTVLAALYFTCIMFFIGIAVSVGVLGVFVVIAFIINGILCSIIASRYNGLTQKGVNEKELWRGLKAYMQDFSLLKEREVPELVLWEKYLVFATVFGISERVIKQLKVVYPELSNEELVGNYTYFHIMNHSRHNLMTISNLNTEISTSYSRAYNVAHSSGSSGGGYGGGFSGGGGGRRWRRPEWAEDKVTIGNVYNCDICIAIRDG